MYVTFFPLSCQTQRDGLSKEKGQFMIIQTLKRSVLADKSVAHFCQIVCSIVGALVMGLGIRKLAALDLTEAQLFVAMTGTVLLTGVFIVLGFLCRAWRRAVQHLGAGDAGLRVL
jgi:hypothetical protein